MRPLVLSFPVFSLLTAQAHYRLTDRETDGKVVSIALKTLIRVYQISMSTNKMSHFSIIAANVSLLYKIHEKMYLNHNIQNTFENVLKCKVQTALILMHLNTISCFNCLYFSYFATLNTSHPITRWTPVTTHEPFSRSKEAS